MKHILFFFIAFLLFFNIGFKDTNAIIIPCIPSETTTCREGSTLEEIQQQLAYERKIEFKKELLVTIFLIVTPLVVSIMIIKNRKEDNTEIKTQKTIGKKIMYGLFFIVFLLNLIPITAFVLQIATTLSLSYNLFAYPEDSIPLVTPQQAHILSIIKKIPIISLLMLLGVISKKTTDFMIDKKRFTFAFLILLTTITFYLFMFGVNLIF